jgi:aryl-alcohol dehydrogenase-like predicted oxidoreductase
MRDDGVKLFSRAYKLAALRRMLHRAPNILLIPGTSSVAHLRENLAAARLALPGEALARLNAIAGRS